MASALQPCAVDSHEAHDILDAKKRKIVVFGDEERACSVDCEGSAYASASPRHRTGTRPKRVSNVAGPNKLRSHALVVRKIQPQVASIQPPFTLRSVVWQDDSKAPFYGEYGAIFLASCSCRLRWELDKLVGFVECKADLLCNAGRWPTARACSLHVIATSSQHCRSS